MINFSNFYEKHTLTIIDALWFTRDVILDYYKKTASKIDPKIQDPIWKEYNEVVKPLYNAKDFLEENINRTFIPLNKEFYHSLMEIVSSSLVIYRKHLEKTQKSTGVIGYGDLIREVDEILSLEGPTKAKKDLYQKFYVTEKGSIREHIKRTEFFISYQAKDNKMACEIKRLLVSISELNEKDVFVAHRDIELSKNWRADIINHLDSCTHLIALCTENYRCSAWGNQEVGYAMAKKEVRIIPLFLEGTRKEHFGFIEGFQALPYYINENNPLNLRKMSAALKVAESWYMTRSS
jgi:hypothetical protein